MNTTDDDQPSLRDRLRYSGGRKPIPDALPKSYYCTYCLRDLYLLPHEFRLCQTRACIEQAIADRDERVFEIQLSIPGLQTQLVTEKADLLAKISELEALDPRSLTLMQYRAVLSSLNANLGFYAKNQVIDQILALKEQIRELSKRLTRPSFSDEFRRLLWERDRKTCYLCQIEILKWDGDSMHIDHVRTRSQGGSDQGHNLRIAHPLCNLRKGDRALTEKRMKAILEELRRFEDGEAEGKLF